MFVAAH
jgi:hypothetical protein